MCPRSLPSLLSETKAGLPQILPALRMAGAAGRRQGGGGGRWGAPVRSRRAEVVTAPGVLGPWGSRSMSAAALGRASGRSLCLGTGLVWELCRAGAQEAKNNDNSALTLASVPVAAHPEAEKTAVRLQVWSRGQVRAHATAPGLERHRSSGGAGLCRQWSGSAASEGAAGDAFTPH